MWPHNQVVPQCVVRVHVFGRLLPSVSVRSLPLPPLLFLSLTMAAHKLLLDKVYSNAKYRNVVAEAQALQEVVVPALAPALSDASAAVARSAGQAWEGVRGRAPEALQAAIDQVGLSVCAACHGPRRDGAQSAYACSTCLHACPTVY